MALEVVLGIDIGGTFTKIGLVDRGGSIHFEDEISTRGYATIEEFIHALHAHVMQSLEQIETSFLLLGIGVGLLMATTMRGPLKMLPTWPGKGKLSL